MKRHEATLQTTKHPPDDIKTEKEKLPKCRGFLRDRCGDCPRLEGERLKECHEYIHRFARIPYIVIDIFMSMTTGDEWKILNYIVRHADFNPSSNNFGKAFLKYADIIAATNIKQPWRCLRKLEELALIRKIHTRHSSRGSVKTLNTIIIRWMKPLKQLSDEKPVNNEKRDKEVPKANLDKAVSFAQYKKEHPVDAETAKAIEFFLASYRTHRKEMHPNMKIAQWQKHVDTFCTIDGDVQDLGIMEDIICQYFKTPYPNHNVDYHIPHFNSEKNKEMLMYDAGLY